MPGSRSMAVRDAGHSKASRYPVSFRMTLGRVSGPVSALTLLMMTGCDDSVMVHVSYLSADRHPASQLQVTLGDRVFRGSDLQSDQSWGNFPSVVTQGFGPNSTIPIKIVLVVPPAETLVVASGSLQTDAAREYRAEIYATQFGPTAMLCFGPTIARPLTRSSAAPPDTLYLFWGEWPRPFVC